MLERVSILHSMNQLSIERRTQVIAALVEGASIRATCRMTGAAKGTVIKTLTRDNGGIHQTPAMAANITDHVWTLTEIVALLPQHHQEAA